MTDVRLGMRPKAGWVIVQPIVEKQVGAIYIPGHHQRKDLSNTITGTVLALEPHKKPDVFDPDRDYGFKIGDKVLFYPFQGTAIPRGDKDLAEWFTLPIADVLGVVED